MGKLEVLRGGGAGLEKRRRAPSAATLVEAVAGRSRDALWALTVDGEHLMANARYRLMAAALEARCRDEYAAVFAGETVTFEHELTPRGAEQRVVVEVHLAPVREEGRVTAVAGYARDISELRRTENALAEACERADQSARMTSRFLANMSHEIRTPLNGVLGMSTLALATQGAPEQREYLEAVRSSGAALLSLVNNVLDLSKLESGVFTVETKSFDVHAALREVVAGREAHAAARGLALRLELDAERVPRRVLGDDARLRQILGELVDNALKFTPRGEVVVMAARGVGDMVRFAVRDSGVGVARERREHIFVPFVQADGSNIRRAGGVGLGLSIASRVVRLMGGELVCESEVDRGSTFSFALGLPSTRDEGPRTRVFPKRKSGEPGLRILLAEDNPVNARLAVRMLERLGHRVDRVENGFQALQAMCRGEHDVVLMDIQMPDMDGLETTRCYRATGGRTVVVALTANASSADADDCREAGMDGYLSKPIDPRELERILARHAGEG